MRNLLDKLEGVAVISKEPELKAFFESLKEKTYDKGVQDTLTDFLGGIVESVNAAKAKIDNPMIVGLYVAEIVSRCVVIMSFMYQTTKKSAKLRSVTGRLDKIPSAIRQAVRVEGFGK